MFLFLKTVQACRLNRDVRPERAPNEKKWIGARSRGARGARLCFAPTRFSPTRFTLRGALYRVKNQRPLHSLNRQNETP